MEGLFDSLTEPQAIEAMAKVRLVAQEHLQALSQRIAENQAMRPEDRKHILETARVALSASGLFEPEPGDTAPEANHGPNT